jgi:hypothetical protein
MKHVRFSRRSFSGMGVCYGSARLAGQVRPRGRAFRTSGMRRA